MAKKVDKIQSITGSACEDPRGIDAVDLEAGLLTHPMGVHQIRIAFERDGLEVYISGSDLARFARLYHRFGDGAIAEFQIEAMTGKKK